MVVGPPGSGKTTTAKLLSARLGLPHTELDGLWWEPNWVEAGSELFIERLRDVIGGDRWVLDGNYFSVGARDVLWPTADTIVWLDFPRWVTVPRVLKRTLKRGLLRTELWSGNRESIKLALRPDSIVRFAYTAHPKYNKRYEGLETDPAFAHLGWFRLKTPAAVRRFLRGLPQQGR